MVGDIFQPTHLLFVLVIALLVLGPKRLPEVGRTLGSGIRDFRQALSGEAPNPPHQPDSQQVSTMSTELRHQPETAADADFSWPEEAIGPTSFDEPVDAASAEPVDVAEAEPIGSASAPDNDSVESASLVSDPTPASHPVANGAGDEDISHLFPETAPHDSGDGVFAPQSDTDQHS